MTTRIMGPTGSRQRRRFLSAPILAMMIGLFWIAGAQAVHDVDKFELDKDASNDLNYGPVGYLNSNINAAVTSINVCQTGEAPAAGDTILIEAERMTVDANNPGSFGGNCAGTKRTYTVTRGAGGTTAAAHSGGAQKIEARVSRINPALLPGGPDWDQVYASWSADNDTTCGELGLVECTFIEDGIGPSIFTQGSSKDHLPVGGWRHTSGASPDKGEIVNAYAAKAIDNGDQILYFGMDRYAVDGSTDIGFWFFQNPVVAEADGTFSGEHVENDILILGTFTQGGATSDIRVFKWVDGGGNEQENIEGPTGAFGDCVPGQDEDNGCATVNNTSIEVPWTYTFKGSSTSGWVPAGGFFEGGVNLTAIGLEGCFSSFLAETRSSPEITAILKDFALGGFEACESGLETTPVDGDGDPIPSGGISIGTGSVSVKDSAELSILGTSQWSGTLSFYLCFIGTDTSSTDLCASGGTQIGSAMNVDQDTDQPILSDAATVTSAGRYCWRGEFESATEGVPDATDSSEGECFVVTPVQPALSTQAIDADGNPLAAPVPFDQPVYDRATLGGTADKPGDPVIDPSSQDPAGGTITFKLYGPGTDAAACDTLAAGFADAYPDGIMVDVNGNGNYTTLGNPFTPAAPGIYHWKADYSGDPPNTLDASHNADCSDLNERVEVAAVPTTLTTRQFVYPQDKAKVAASAGGNLEGSVTFRLYDNVANCEAGGATGLLLTDGPHAISGASPQFATTDNTTVAVTSNTTVYWNVAYESTNPAQLGSSSVCVESTAVTFAGNDGTITVP